MESARAVPKQTWGFGRAGASDGVDAPRRHRCAKVAGVEAPLRRGASMGEVGVIGLDLAKNVFQAHGAGVDGSVIFRLKLSRAQLLKVLAAHAGAHAEGAGRAGLGQPHGANRVGSAAQGRGLPGSGDRGCTGQRRRVVAGSERGRGNARADGHETGSGEPEFRTRRHRVRGSELVPTCISPETPRCMSGRIFEAGHRTAPDHMPERARDPACIQGGVHTRRGRGDAGPGKPDPALDPVRAGVAAGVSRTP